MKRFHRIVSILFLLSMIGALLYAIGTSAQATVTAEAVGTANLRALPSTDSDIRGEIAAGTRYPVLGRSEFFPWYLLADPVSNQPIGWVFADLVTVQGDPNTLPFTEAEVGGSAQVLPTPTLISTLDPAANTTPVAATPTAATPVASTGVTGTALNEINIRYGPGVDFPRLGVARPGEVLQITAWHTQFPWVQIAYPSAPNGEAWVSADVLEIQGDVTSLRAITQTNLNLPTLTPTPVILQQNPIIGVTPVPLSPEFTALGNQLWDTILSAGYDPQTSRFGALFLMDVQTGEAISFGDQVAFSGISINKVAILAEYYRQLDAPPRDIQAYSVAEAMVCSENISTNEMLAEIGGGNPYTGAEQVSSFLEQFGAGNSFIYTPFNNDPFITPQAPRQPRITNADQISAVPDPYNQMTIAETGALLNGLYQCGYNESGALLEAFPDEFTPTECRQMLNVMSHNRIGTLIEMGVPADVQVAHKHGWITDTLGDAAVVFSPGGTYILVIVLHNQTDWVYTEAKPVVEEVSRLVYNYFNPDAPMAEVRLEDPAAQGDVATCNANLFGSQLIEDMMSSEFIGSEVSSLESGS